MQNISSIFFHTTNMNLSFEEIFMTYRNMVFNLCLHYVQRPEDAEEIAQDVFVVVHQKYATFQGHASLKTWIYRITINHCLDFLKAQKRQKRFALFLSWYRPNGTTPAIDLPDQQHPGIALEQKESLTTLLQCINDLPEQQKTAVILLKIEQKTTAETAEIMQLSPKAVESLLQRAKKKLLEKLPPREG